MVTTTCEFYNPYYFDIATKTILPFDTEAGTQYWNFGSMRCSTTDSKIALIENAETGAEFYVEKTLNYGEAMIIWFLTIFLIAMIFKTAYNFFWKK